ncbi:MAG: hypothetical protein HND44_22495 [Chloroflexi bacterium]|nr:hypothetical protein [Ardenticatenaceae bacterium]MBL1131210.1 hypothetical protein [Chloroflexota bacterium]NOG37312.1 hypothetical protein [Chloroflexota bacterium]
MALGKLRIAVYDGDHFHPPQNAAKMAGGHPLSDEDRRPWLARLHGMKAPMLQSQFDALQPPDPDEAITIPADEDIETILELIQTKRNRMRINADNAD